MKTLKEYLNSYDDYDDELIINKCVSINQFTKDLFSMQKQSSYANSSETINVSNKPKGLITLKEFFDPKNEGDFEGQVEEWVNDFDKLIKKYGNWVIQDEDEDIADDSTYNYEAPMETDIRLRQVTIVNNDDSNPAFESKDLVFFAVTTALSYRGQGSNYVVAIFDNDLNDHYMAQAFMNASFDVAEGTCEYQGKTYEFNLEARPNCDTLLLETSHTPTSADDEQYDVVCDATDADSIQDAIANAFNVDAKQLKLTELNYICNRIG